MCTCASHHCFILVLHAYSKPVRFRRRSLHSVTRSFKFREAELPEVLPTGQQKNHVRHWRRTVPCINTQALISSLLQLPLGLSFVGPRLLYSSNSVRSCTMSDHDEEKRSSQSITDVRQDPPSQHERPSGLLGLYYNPVVQVVMLGFVCFMGPGLFNALNGLGGGGQLDPTTSANANAAVYATFAFMAFFAGWVSLFRCAYGLLTDIVMV